MNPQEEKLRSAGRYAGMPAETRAAVWRGIKEQMLKELASEAGAEAALRGKLGRRWFRSGAVGTGAAAVAAVAIVAGGFWAASAGGLLGGRGITGAADASNRATNGVISGVGNAALHASTSQATPPSTTAPGPKVFSGGVPLSLPSSWSGITMIDSTPAAIAWSPIVFTQTVAEIRSLLRGATPVSLTMPPQLTIAIRPNIPLPRLQLSVGGKTTAIEPAYYLTSTSPNNATGQTRPSYEDRYVNNVIAVETSHSTHYYRDPAMFEWLKNLAWKVDFQPGVSANTTQYSDAQLAAMTPAELAAYTVKHGHPLPFASGNMVRNVPSKLLLASDPKSGSMLPPEFGTVPGTLAGDIAASYPLVMSKSDQFQVVDRWTGSVGSQQGVAIEVDRKVDGSEYLVAIARGPRETVYAFPAQVLITNFTGSYMVFSAENSTFYGLNLRTGSLIHGTTPAKMSSDYGSIGNTIVGLPQSYPAQPVIGGTTY